MTATLATISVFIVMLALLVTRTIAVTKKLRSVMIGATLGIVLFYLASSVLPSSGWRSRSCGKVESGGASSASTSSVLLHSICLSTST